MTHSLILRLAKAQTDASSARKFIRRVRLLYIRFVWMHVLTDPTQGSLDRAVKRMKESGMYASATGDRQVRYTILRRCWTLETGKVHWSHFEKDNWHAWHQRHGFAAVSWVKREKIA